MKFSPATFFRWFSPGSLLAIGAGALNTLAFAPFGLWPLAILSPLALYLLLRNLSARAAFGRGFAYGFGFWLSGASWVYVSIHTYGYTPITTAVCLTLLFAAFLSLFFFAWWTAFYAHLARGVLRPALFIALWILGEWSRNWIFTGFPWLHQGYAFIDTPLAGFAPLGGVLLMSALVIGGAVLLPDLVQGTRRARLIALAAITTIAVSGQALKQISWTTPVGNPQRVSLMQGNIPQDMKWLLDMQQPTIDIYTALSEPEWGRDLLIWPEAAVPMYAYQATELLDRLQARAELSGSTLILGIPHVARSGDTEQDNYIFHNSLLGLGRTPAIYHKVKLVPFGEYVPLAPLFRAIAPFFSLPQIPLEGFSSGQEEQKPLTAGALRIEPFICYEIVYADHVRRHAADRDVLLTVSNDAWFGESHGPRQHFQIARMRALETGRFLLRGTNTGVSGIIDPHGAVVAEAPQFARTVLRGEVTAMRGSTPFMVVGEWPVLGICAGLLLLALRRRLPATVRLPM